MIVQQVDTVQATRRMCSELDIMYVQGIEYMLEENFYKAIGFYPCCWF
jgi:hypothetical protein